jgi:hypothetical protein
VLTDSTLLMLASGALLLVVYWVFPPYRPQPRALRQKPPDTRAGRPRAPLAVKVAVWLAVALMWSGVWLSVQGR